MQTPTAVNSDAGNGSLKHSPPPQSASLQQKRKQLPKQVNAAPHASDEAHGWQTSPGALAMARQAKPPSAVSQVVPAAQLSLVSGLHWTVPPTVTQVPFDGGTLGGAQVG